MSYVYLPHRRKAYRGYSNDPYTKLLLHMDGVDDAQVFKDSSLSRHTLTANGNAKTEDTQKKFGPTSGYFDRVGDYLSIATSSDFDFRTYTTSWTIDCWVWAVHVTHGASVWAIGTTDYNIIASAWDDSSVPDKQVFTASDDGASWTALVYGDTNITFGTWQHWAYVNNAGTFKMYLDGVETGTATFDANLYLDNYSLKVGGHYALNANWMMNGYIDELRVSKGIARWTANFTPPTKAYS